MDSLAIFHESPHLRVAGKLVAAPQEALSLARRAKQMAEAAFPQPIDPVGGETGALRQLTTKLVDSIREFEKN